MTDDTPAVEHPDDETVLIDTAAAALFHGVHPRTIRKWIDADKLQAQMVGNAYFIPVTRAELLAKGLNPDEVPVARKGTEQPRRGRFRPGMGHCRPRPSRRLTSNPSPPPSATSPSGTRSWRRRRPRSSTGN